MVYLVSIANCMAAAAGVRASHSSTCSLTLDDTQIAFMTRAQGKYRMRTMVLLYPALGFFLSLDKCSLLPQHRNRYLGADSRCTAAALHRASRQGQQVPSSGSDIPAAADNISKTSSTAGGASVVIRTSSGVGAAAVHSGTVSCSERHTGKYERVSGAILMTFIWQRQHDDRQQLCAAGMGSTLRFWRRCQGRGTVPAGEHARHER